MTIPDLMPILSAGAHEGPEEGACIMELASFLAGEKWSDFPACTNRTLARAAQQVNDQFERDADRQRLLELLPRVMGTPENSTEITIAIATAAADYVKPLVGHRHIWVDDNARCAQRNLARALLAAAPQAIFNAVASVTCDAMFAVDASGGDLVHFLSTIIDAYDVAVGRTEASVVTEDDLRRCAELTGAKA